MVVMMGVSAYGVALDVQFPDGGHRGAITHEACARELERIAALTDARVVLIGPGSTDGTTPCALTKCRKPLAQEA